MMAHPLISVVTAVRNGAPYLKDLIESVLKQDYPNIEHIIIDDGSTDGGETVNILKQYSHLRWWSRENRGQYATQNEGLEVANGDIVTVISADDVYANPHAFSQVVNYMQAHPDCELVYGKTLHMDKFGDLLPYQLDITGWYPQWFMRHYLYIQHCSLFVARRLIHAVNVRFDRTYRYAGDWDWIVRLFKATSTAGYIPEPLAILRIHDGQTSVVARRAAVDREHQTVCQRNGASYRMHLVIRKMIQYRSMAKKAVGIARSGGVKSLMSYSNNWLARRTRERRTHKQD